MNCHLVYEIISPTSPFPSLSPHNPFAIPPTTPHPAYRHLPGRPSSPYKNPPPSYTSTSNRKPIIFGNGSSVELPLGSALQGQLSAADQSTEVSRLRDELEAVSCHRCLTPLAGGYRGVVWEGVLSCRFLSPPPLCCCCRGLSPSRFSPPQRLLTTIPPPNHTT